MESNVSLAALVRVANVIIQVRCTWRFVHDSFKMPEYSPRWSLLDVVSKNCTSPVMMELELYLAIYDRVRVILYNPSLLINMRGALLL